MASVQERLQMNRALLDTWNTREQLCLASAVSCSGDQNWMSVSRNLKLVCGNHNESNNRPADFFSQKSCALQYAHLLENVETPKRKKRSSESNSRVSSPATTIGETPTDLVLRMKTEERIQELKAEIRKDQEEYSKIYAELQKIQSPQLSEEKLREMWREIEQEQEAQRIAEMKLENQLREREQKRIEMQRSWRLGSTAVATLSPVVNVKQQDNEVVDMDVEEIIGVSKTITPSQQHTQQPTATSPLLSSLLKSPTTTVPPPPLTLSTTSTARANAPTITTLLTSGSIPQTNQPAITLNSNLIPPEKAVQLLTRPISGPPAADSFNSSNTAAQHLLSPSQSAPTLSMLLERSKSVNLTNQANITVTTTNESKKEEIPMDVDVASKPDEAITTEATADSDETDPNEEQQLLEVFKNIGDITNDELDIDVSVIDEEVDFLKGVDDSPNNANETINLADKMDTVAQNTIFANSKSTNIEKTENKIDTTVPKTDSKDREGKVIKIETSSDDSNDNIPLAAVATLEHKDRCLSTTPSTTETVDEKLTSEQSFLKEKEESATPKNVENVKQESPSTETNSSHQKNEQIIETVKDESNETSDDVEIEKNASLSKNVDTDVVVEKKEMAVNAEQDVKSTTEDEDDQMERFSTPTGDEKFPEQEITTVKDEDNKSDPQPDYENDLESSVSNATVAAVTIDESHDRESHESSSNNDINTSSAPLPPPSIASTIADTDEDSCTTDNSIINKRDDQKSSTTPSTSAGKLTTEKSSSSSSQSRKISTQESATAAAVKSSATDDSDSSSTNRVSKRSLLSILSNLSASKSAQCIQRALNEDQIKHNYQKICYRHFDFQTIKKNIENGSIRTTLELQRDLLLMTQNLYFLFSHTNSAYKAAEIFKHEMQNIREFIFNTNEFEAKNEKEVREIKQSATKQVRTGSRKSLRIA